ncbi:FAD-dependent oxidoreductase [Desulforudis sp. DRI-14]|uniref:FAD-dependent oxidoreductase n=1 Tax=Desulforudis sp. DRI-14 TaxID=3459793 RepID=UPI004042347C
MPGTLSADEALAQALEEIRSERFLTALRRFPGFEKVELVRDADGRPVTGKILYLRESIHCLDKSGAHALTGEEVRGAGNASLEGVDQQNYASRVGLGCYYIDINAYLKSEPAQILETPYNPVYIPGEAVLTPNVPNLLVPGYAQSTDSTAWAAMRVIPNLSVCGDAAGGIAALCVSHSETPAEVLANRIQAVRQAILNLGGRIDKGSNS